MSNLHFLEHKIHALNCCLLSLLFCHSYWNPMGTENVIMEENEWRGGAGIIVSYWHCYCAVSVYRPAVCYVRLAAAAERRNVNPGHVSTSETLQSGTHHTQHYTLLTLHTTLWTSRYQYPPPHLTSVISSGAAYMTIQSTKSLCPLHYLATIT